MNWWNRSVDKLIYPKDREDAEAYMKAKFFVGSTIIFVWLCILSIPYFLLVNPEEVAKHPELFYSSIVGTAIISIILFIYKKFGGRVIIVNIIMLFGIGGNPGIYAYNGGIFSPDNIWGIVMSAWVFLVASRSSGYLWMTISIAILTFFYYAEATGQRDFFGDLAHMKGDYFFFNWFLAGIFLLIIISLYESSKKKFVTDLKASKEEIEVKKKELEVQKADITASINYAKRIQYAVLPQEDTIYRSIPLSFILYKPKDIVSGDFFWFHEIDRDNYLIVCADCTGHGVPGAMMTVIGSSLLNQTVIDNKATKPSQIMLILDNLINVTLKQQKEHENLVQDGMDLSLLRVDKAKKEFIYTSAKRPAVFIRNKQVQDFKGSKQTLGGMITGCKVFEEIKMSYQEDDIIYFFTDGYTDQFGGPKGKKFSSKQLKELLFSIHRLPMNEQKNRLESTIENWKGNLEQVDDILVMGIRF